MDDWFDRRTLQLAIFARDRPADMQILNFKRDKSRIIVRAVLRRFKTLPFADLNDLRSCALNNNPCSISDDHLWV